MDDNIAQLAPSTVRDYIELTKPGVLLLIVFTATTGLIIAEQSINFFLSITVILAIALASSGSAAINMWYDRDIDRLMVRTKNRPVAAKRITADNALAFGSILILISAILMFLATNVLATIILLFASFFYIYVYTIWLKRITPQNIVIGGAAGAFPPVISYAAVTNSISLNAVLLFLIVFIWTPPHFWALALKKNNDYKIAKIPMMPLAKGIPSTINHIIFYSILLCILTYALMLSMPQLGYLYLIVTTLSNIKFLQLVYMVRKDWEKYSMKLFGFSILYLFLIFGIINLEFYI
ncbi:MAG: protoheme IX farnesyltransferase [Rickettsiales bacterium]|nr:protoheme IX farnesyltransferase [Rickettsiales bacterium]